MSIKVVAGVGIVAAFVGGLWLGRATVARAEPKGRVFEFRMYTAAPGKLADVQAFFRHDAVRLFQKHEMTSVGYWQPQDDPLSKNTFFYMLSFPSRAAAEKAWDELKNDPDWRKAREKSDANGKLVTKTDTFFMDPLDFSPLK